MIIHRLEETSTLFWLMQISYTIFTFFITRIDFSQKNRFFDDRSRFHNQKKGTLHFTFLMIGLDFCNQKKRFLQSEEEIFTIRRRDFYNQKKRFLQSEEEIFYIFIFVNRNGFYNKRIRSYSVRKKKIFFYILHF